MINKVYEFNKKRNGFKFNKELEVNMYREEQQEFYNAESLAERVDAYCDMEYVVQGTELKSLLFGEDNPNLENWTRMEPMARGIISGELVELGLDFNSVIEKARQIVVNANEVKGSNLDENGKVSKEANIPNATNQIKELIEGLTNDNKTK